MKKKDDDLKYTRCFYSDDIDFWISFFEQCRDKKIGTDNPDGREKLLIDMMNERKFKGCYVADYNKSREELVEHFGKKYGKVKDLSSMEKVQQFKNELEASRMNQELCPTCNQPMSLLGYGWTCMSKDCAIFGLPLLDEPTENQLDWSDTDILPGHENNTEEDIS